VGSDGKVKIGLTIGTYNIEFGCGREIVRVCVCTRARMRKGEIVVIL